MKKTFNTDCVSPSSMFGPCCLSLFIIFIKSDIPDFMIFMLDNSSNHIL